MVHAGEAGGLKQAPLGTGNFMHIVDRRLNPSGKSLANRQRFLRRAKSLIRKAVHESSASRSIKDVDQGGRGRASRRTACTSRRFHRSASGGMRDHRAARQQGVHRRRHDPAPAGRRRRRRLGRQPGRRRRGRFPLRAVARGVPRPLPRRPRTAGSRQAPRRGHRERRAGTAPAIRSPARRPTSRCCAPCATACRAASR